MWHVLPSLHTPPAPLQKWLPLPPSSLPFIQICSQRTHLVPSLIFSHSGSKNGFFCLIRTFMPSLAVLRWMTFLIYYYYYCLDTWRQDGCLIHTKYWTKFWSCWNHWGSQHRLQLGQAFLINFVTDCTMLGPGFPKISLFVSLFCLNQIKLLKQLTRKPPVTGTKKGEFILTGKRNFPDVAYSLHAKDKASVNQPLLCFVQLVRWAVKSINQDKQEKTHNISFSIFFHGKEKQTRE